MKQEYKVVLRSDLHSSHKAELVQIEVNKILAEGWELILVEPYGFNAFYHFIRKVQ